MQITESLIANCAADQRSRRVSKNAGLRVFVMDLLSVVAYYDTCLCRALKAEGMRVTLGAITYHLDRSCFKRAGLRNQPGFLDVVGSFRLPNFIRRILKTVEVFLNLLALTIRFTRKRPDVVHVQYLPLLERRIAVELWWLNYCRFLGSALVMTVHDIAPHDRGETRTSEFRRAFEMMDALICHSEAAKQQIVAEFSVPADRVWTIPHGPLFFESAQTGGRAAARSRCGVEGDEPIVLCQGMIRPYKGIEFLIDGWNELKGRGSRGKLVIAGKGESRLLDKIRQKVDALRLAASVHLCFEFAPTEVMMSYYLAADIVVYPYKSITTSGALMTGIAQRKPIAATSLAPFREILEDGKNALLCEYGDVEGLAAALQRLIDSPSLREKLANAAATLSCGEQTWRDIAVRTKECYASITRHLETSKAHSVATV